MQMISCIVLAILYGVSGEVIDRNAVSSAATVIECTNFPCTINCNTVLSCYSATINCPSVSSGVASDDTCTINVLADSGGERSKINTNAASNVVLNLRAYESLWLATITAGNVASFTVDVQDTHRALFNSNINIQSVSGDLSFTVNGNSYHAFYSMALVVDGDIGGNAQFIENTDGAINANFAGKSTIQINGDIGGNLLFEARIDNGNEAFDDSSCVVTGSVGGSLTMLSGTFGSFSESDYEVRGGVAGDILLLDTSAHGHGFCCGSDFNFLGSIGGSVSVRDETPGTIGGRSAYNANFRLGSVAGNVEFIEIGAVNGAGRSFVSTTYNIASVGGNLLFEARVDNGFEAFDDSSCIVSGSVGGDLTMLSGTFGSFSESDYEVTGGVGGDILLLDTSAKGHGFCCSSDFKFLGNIGGSVSVRDETPGSIGGRSAHDADFELGNVAGNVEFIENGGWGRSFKLATFDIASVGGNLLFESKIDFGTADKQAFDLATFTIGPVTGDLSFLSNTFGSFSECQVTVNGDVGGNILLLDTAIHGRGFCCGSNWNFLGAVAGSVSVRDETPGAIGGHSAYDANFDFRNVAGNVEFIENSDSGWSFWSTTYDIGSVGGNLLFSAMIDNGKYAFGTSTFTIGTVDGELSVLSNTIHAFQHGAFNIDTVKTKSSFIGTASGGYDFYSADITIKNCPHILIQADNNYNTYDSHNTFGVINAANGGVGLVEVIMNGGLHAIHSTLFDAQYADEFKLTCNNDADCTDVEIKCPEDNQQNKCQIYCGSVNADCRNIDLFTTNGYCKDATFYCLEAASDCLLTSLSQVFCTVGTGYNYGVRGTQCQINKDVNSGKYYCLDIGAAQCSTEAVCEPTTSPTKSPSKSPSKSPTKLPSKSPTKSPTKTPTAPPTFAPCTDTSEAYNIEFILDESGSVNKENPLNYGRSVDFVVDLIRDSVNSVSKVSALAFGTVNDEIYGFTDPQDDGRAGIIAALEAEKANYASGWTATYDALVEGKALFDGITDNNNKILILVTDGRPTLCEDYRANDPDCVDNICASGIDTTLKDAGIQVYIIGIGDFDPNTLDCLVNDKDNDIERINDFTQAEFDRIEGQFRSKICPGEAPEGPSAHTFVNKNMELNENNLNNNNNNHGNYEWVSVNALMSVIATLFIILLVYGCYYYICKALRVNRNYSKVRIQVVNDDELQQINI